MWKEAYSNVILGKRAVPPPIHLWVPTPIHREHTKKT